MTVTTRDTRKVSDNNERVSTEIIQKIYDMQKIYEAVNNTPDLDIKKVNAIKQQIAEGKYQISAEKIANKLTDLEAL